MPPAHQQALPRSFPTSDRGAHAHREARRSSSIRLAVERAKPLDDLLFWAGASAPLDEVVPFYQDAASIVQRASSAPWRIPCPSTTRGCR
jgi:hypothetical protein